LPAEGIVH